jgi:hypothetical protein
MHLNISSEILPMAHNKSIQVSETSHQFWVRSRWFQHIQTQHNIKYVEQYNSENTTVHIPQASNFQPKYLKLNKQIVPFCSKVSEIETVLPTNTFSYQ